MNQKTLYIIIPFLFLLFSGCGSNKISVLDYQHTITKKQTIDETCAQNSSKDTPKVGVVKFTNNTPYTDAKTNYTKDNQEASIYVGVTPIGAGAGAKNNKTKYTESRTMDSKLSEAITSPLEDLITQMGGATLISRSEMDIIDEEQKLQDSGLLDANTIVEFGKLSGIDYIITGSIDNVEEKYQDLKSTSKLLNVITLNSDNKKVQAAGLLTHLGVALSDGLTIKTKVSVKMIDVQTGEIVFTKTLQNKKFVGKVKEASFDQIVGGVKASIIESLPTLEDELSKQFSPYGYITQIKSKTKEQKELIAQINLGSIKNIKEGDSFSIYKNESYLDPITNEKRCDMIKLPLLLTVTNQINQKTSWATVEGDVRYLRLGQTIKKEFKE